MAGYFRMNGLLTFGIGGSLGLANATLRPFPGLQESAEQVRLNVSLIESQYLIKWWSNQVMFTDDAKSYFFSGRLKYQDFSIIGAALGGLGTAAIFAHRGFWQVLSMIPGGASMGIAGGFLTGIIQRDSERPAKPNDRSL